MGLKTDFIEYLANLPAVSTVDERKVLIQFTNLSYLDIYLDWQGSSVIFFQRLLDELGRRGREAMDKFIEALPNAAQVGVDRQDEIRAKGQSISALSEAEWMQEFGVTEQSEAISDPSPDMLATTVVSTILTPYLQDDSAMQPGPKQLAKQVLDKVEAALTSDPTASATFPIYKSQPETGQAFVLPAIKNLLASNSALTSELSEMITKAESEENDVDFQNIVNVAQEIGTVNGDVVGAIMGADVMNGIQATVTQTVDRVESGGTVVGAVVGGSSGTQNIGGSHTHNHGDQVDGNKNVIDTGGGANIQGDVSVDGDFVGRDKIVRGDKIDGDKISVGDISGSSGIAIGRNASANVTTNTGMDSAALAAAFAPLLAAVQSAPVDKQSDAAQKINALQAEATKGSEADDETVGGLVQDLAEIIPDAVGTIGAMFAGPLGGLAGPATKFVLKRLGIS